MLCADPESQKLVWRKASRSIGDGDCLEIANASKGAVVRDSKNRAGPVLFFATPVWRAFLAESKRENVLIQKRCSFPFGFTSFHVGNRRHTSCCLRDGDQAYFTTATVTRPVGPQRSERQHRPTYPPQARWTGGEKASQAVTLQATP
jgi:hypothetical protein